MSDLKIQSDNTIYLIQTDDENIKKVSYSSNKGYIEVVIDKKLKMSVSKDDTVKDSSKLLGSYGVHPSSTSEKFNAENTIFVEARVPELNLMPLYFYNFQLEVIICFCY
ncbi:32390_t:CDS:2 [Gigaspora margarita]|uniref:32390_t:CDS:1 n=1 Tax=Gigaspora margarita TaxID=4874 RepID=A0ABN7W7P3_GIGMA|nr:32390_t:CDS:2 [Gigaspora margarita]